MSNKDYKNLFKFESESSELMGGRIYINEFYYPIHIEDGDFKMSFRLEPSHEIQIEGDVPDFEKFCTCFRQTNMNMAMIETLYIVAKCSEDNGN